MDDPAAANPNPSQPSPLTRVARWLLAALAVACFGLGWVGLFVPGLPTTIFWILAVLLAGKACPVVREWVYGQGKAGGLVRSVVEERALPRRAKQHAVIGLWVSLSASMAVLLWLRGATDPIAWLLPVVGLGVSWLIWRGLQTAEPG